MNSELSKENTSVTMTEEEYFNKVSAALNDPVKLNEVTKLQVEFVESKEESKPDASVVNLNDEKQEDPEGEGGSKETAEATSTTETESKETPFGKDGLQNANKQKDPTPPKKSDEVTTVTPSSGELGKVRGELDLVKKERDEWKHKFTSNAGRIAAYQKTIADLKAQVALLEGNGRQDKPAEKDEGSKKSKLRENPTLKRMQETDPVLAEMMAELLEAQEKEIRNEFEGGLKQTQKVVTERQQNEFVFQEAQRLREVVRNLDEVVTSPEYNFFYEKVATPGIKALLDSEFADDAIQGLHIYSQWYEVNVPKPESKEQPKKGEPAAKTTDDEAAKLLEARNRRLQAKDVSSAQTIPKGDGQFDPEKYFEEVHNKALQRILPRR